MMAFSIRSSAFTNGSPIPKKYTCLGDNISPPLTWLDAPEETVSFVLTVTDPDAAPDIFTHWMLYNIDGAFNNLPEGAVPGEGPMLGVERGRNDFGELDYRGPCPPVGPAHRYFFRLYAINEKVELPSGATREQILSAISENILAHTQLMGSFASEIVTTE
jgi:Raf kinase inhibitor-like YbhB/YbcL family protein